MTKQDGAGLGGQEHEPTRITVKDNRRIDPATGQARDVPQPGSAAADPGDPANATQPMTATVIEGSAELEAARAEAAERTADLQRITAEYANYRKRADRDKQAAGVVGKATVVAELLGVLDDFDRAEEHGDLTGAFKAVAEKVTGTLTRLGLTAFGAEGDEFDPNVHEAVQFATAADVTQPTVTTVLRPAVVVVTGPEHDTPEAADTPSAPDAPGGSDVSGDAESAAEQ